MKRYPALLANVEPRDVRVCQDPESLGILLAELFGHLDPVREKAIASIATILDVAMQQIDLNK